ncbi:MAG: YfhO family protein, partial [Thermoanaerobaculia bacterium]
QSSALSLIRFLALPLPLADAMTAEAAFKLLIALTLMYLYCRRRGYSEMASTIGATSFAFCTFLIVWLHFPIVTVAAFLPAVFLSIDLLIERGSQVRFAFSAIVWGVMLMGGHPETVSHAFFLALLYVLWIVFVERPFGDRRQMYRSVFRIGAALAVGALLAAAFLAPFGEAVTRSKRFQELKSAPNAIGYYSDFASQVILLQPHFYGDVPVEKSWGPAHAESITGFAGILGVAAWIALLLRTIFLRRWRSREAFFVVATPIVLGIILAWPVVSTLFHLIFSLAANARLRLLLCFLLSTQAAAVLSLIERERAWWYLAGVAAAACVLLALMKTIAFPSAFAHDTAMLSILPSMVVLLVASLVPLAGRWRAVPMALLIVFVIGELWKVDRDWNPVLPAKLWYPKTPLIAELEKLREQQPRNAPFRIVGMGPVFFPNAPAMFGLEDIRAHDPMANGRYIGILRVMTGYDPSDYFAKWENLSTPLVNFLNVKYVVSAPRWRPDEQNRYRLIYDGRDGTIFQNLEVMPRFFPVRNVVLEFKRDLFLNRLLNQADWASTVLVRNLPVENDRERLDLLAPRPVDAPEATLAMISAT